MYLLKRASRHLPASPLDRVILFHFDPMPNAAGAAPEAAPPPAAAGDFFGAAVTPVLVEAALGSRMVKVW